MRSRTALPSSIRVSPCRWIGPADNLSVLTAKGLGSCTPQPFFYAQIEGIIGGKTAVFWWSTTKIPPAKLVKPLNMSEIDKMKLTFDRVLYSMYSQDSLSD